MKAVIQLFFIVFQGRALAGIDLVARIGLPFSPIGLKADDVPGLFTIIDGIVQSMFGIHEQRIGHFLPLERQIGQIGLQRVLQL